MTGPVPGPAPGPMSGPMPGPGSLADQLGVVRVVGTGLVGTSIGLALRRAGVDVLLDDPSPTALAVARDLGAGVPDRSAPADLVVVAAPADVTVDVASRALAASTAVVTDVASVKGTVLQGLRQAGADLRRFIGGHPMIGLPHVGAIAAHPDLFAGQSWVLCPDGATAEPAEHAVRRLITALGATPVLMDADEHDSAVALVWQVPQLAASLLSARLANAPEVAVALAGPGLRELAGIACHDATRWAQLLSANAGPVHRVLSGLVDDLGAVTDALAAIAGNPSPAPGSRAEIAAAIDRGNTGRERIPARSARR